MEKRMFATKGGTETARMFSIIVPVYQVAAYLPACLDSIVSQSCQDWELILVDDGSQDGGGSICDAYAARDGRIRAIHKKNGGLSDARNAGMRVAGGRYLLFVDGDDLIAEGSLEAVAGALRAQELPDVLFLRAEMLFADGTLTPYGIAWTEADFVGKSQAQVLALLSTGGQAHVSACVKAIRREVAEAAGAFWPGIVGEDVDFSIGLYLRATTYGLCGAPYYRYRQARTGSIMSQKSGKRFVDLLGILRKWTALADGEYRPQRQWILRFLFHQYYTLLLVYAAPDAQTHTKEHRREMARFSYLLRYTDNPRIAAVRATLRVCGVGMTARLLAWMENRQSEGSTTKKKG